MSARMDSRVTVVPTDGTSSWIGATSYDAGGRRATVAGQVTARNRGYPQVANLAVDSHQRA